MRRKEIFTETVALTTAANGIGAAYSNHLTGRLIEIRYTKTDFADGSTMAVSLDDPFLYICWQEANVNASTVRRPMAQAHSILGAALHYNDEGDEPVVVPYILTGKRIKVAIVAGGATKTGTFTFVYEN